MKIVILTLCFVLSGCMTTAVPVKRNFPVAPETLLTPCPELKKLEKDNN